MRDQFLNDGIENFDFHTSIKIECSKLSQLILDGEYVPGRSQRILVEKSKGLCRQLVIPTVRDALVLQCLSDALYEKIREKSPTKKSFFEPREHRFSAKPTGYGTFSSWLNFQRELFDFSKNRSFVVVTDIANYYDSISYHHLRNVISSISGVEECVLDMLLFVLSDLLWQPDYTPRVEVGLPQINLDAPRLLAHCFLYELDAFLDSDPNRDFVRYMDDIDIGVDTAVAAKQILRSIDLVLQTKQIRLNSGKTRILTRREAIAHFRVMENASIDRLQARITHRQARGLNLDRALRVVQSRIRQGLKSGDFDEGNGEKILKRWIGLAGSVGARIRSDDLRKIILLRPSVRENVFSFIRRADLTETRAQVLASTAGSGHLADDAALVDMANNLVETAVTTTYRRKAHILKLISAFDEANYFQLYAKIWLQSKYEEPEEILETIRRTTSIWVPQERMGRVIGSLAPLFQKTACESQYRDLIGESRNHGCRETFVFHNRLRTQMTVFRDVYGALRNPNPSRGTGITHGKYLCLLSALQNQAAPAAQILMLRSRNSAAFRDIYYRKTARRLGV